MSESVDFTVAAVFFLQEQKKYPSESLAIGEWPDEHFQPTATIVDPNTKLPLAYVQFEETAESATLEVRAKEYRDLFLRTKNALPVFLLSQSKRDKYSVCAWRLTPAGKWEEISNLDFPSFDALRNAAHEKELSIARERFIPITEVPPHGDLHDKLQVVKFSIFISSTFLDLRKERQDIVETILAFGGFPLGMELFPASPDDPLTLIKSVIKESDYYVILLGGRYGSLHKSGFGYTEIEYEYALSQKIPVIALLHESPESLPPEKRESDANLVAKFEKFRKRLQHELTPSYWSNDKSLCLKAFASLSNALNSHPRPGWIRREATKSVETSDISTTIKGSQAGDVGHEEERVLTEMAATGEEAVPEELGQCLGFGQTKTRHLLDSLLEKEFLEENINQDGELFYYFTSKARTYLVSKGLVK